MAFGREFQITNNDQISMTKISNPIFCSLWVDQSVLNQMRRPITQELPGKMNLLNADSPV
jgi:hypothetical protein